MTGTRGAQQHTYTMIVDGGHPGVARTIEVDGTAPYAAMMFAQRELPEQIIDYTRTGGRSAA